MERRLRRKERAKRLRELYGPSAKRWTKKKVNIYKQHVLIGSMRWTKKKVNIYKQHVLIGSMHRGYMIL